MNEKLILNSLDVVKFDNASSLLKCFHTLGEKLSELASTYRVDSMLKFIKRNEEIIARIFTSKSEVWTGSKIYEMLFEINGFSKNSRQKTEDLVKKFKIVEGKGKITNIQLIGNEIVISFDEVILDNEEYINLSAFIYAINTYIAYIKMEMLTDDFDIHKFNNLRDDNIANTTKTINNISVVKKELIIRCTGNKKIPFKLRKLGALI